MWLPFFTRMPWSWECKGTLPLPPPSASFMVLLTTMIWGLFPGVKTWHWGVLPSDSHDKKLLAPRFFWNESPDRSISTLRHPTPGQLGASATRSFNSFWGEEFEMGKGICQNFCKGRMLQNDGFIHHFWWYFWGHHVLGHGIFHVFLWFPVF